MLHRPLFWLGVHEPAWMARTDVPLFVSHHRLRRRKRMPAARGPWVLDSGAFSTLATHGRFLESAEEYATWALHYLHEIGGMVWCAPQDWMCEPFMLARTGLTVAHHQHNTVASYLALADLRLPVVPVLQGWTLDDYADHIELYRASGVDLKAMSLVGLGSVCKRQATTDIGRLVGQLANYGLRLHGFGVKVSGLRLYGHQLVSADSMAWSYDARRSPPIAGHQHRNCANCLPYALRWRERVACG